MHRKGREGDIEMTETVTKRKDSIAVTVADTGYDTFLTVKEVCEWLNLKRSFVYRLANDGELPSMRIGRLVRFRKSDIDAWIKNHYN
jgi:excisionase family DNA binding protein